MHAKPVPEQQMQDFVAWFQWLMKVGLAATLATLGISTANANQVTKPSEPFQLVQERDLKAEFVEALERDVLSPIVSTVPGSAVVVVVDGEVVLQKTWGVRQSGDRQPITPFTRSE